MLFQTAVVLAAAAAPAHHHGAGLRPAVHVVAVAAHDYAFDAPDSLAAGAIEFRMTNHGTEPHHVVVYRFDGAHRLADFAAYVKNAKPGENPIPSWAHEEGGPNAAAPHGESAATLVLEPGNYALVCVIPSPDGVPHAMKGMMRPLTVVPAAGAAGAAALPAADRTLTLRDYAFDASKPITAGRHTIRVENAGTQWHEVLVVRLAPGKSIEDFARWVEKPEGAPAGEMLGGISPMQRGGEATFTADFTPGRYALICFLPDAKDGKPHFLHGMTHTFTVAGRGAAAR